jgi:L-alanine-DL-glutamate epimerase-like enolase superfamily enzyme
VRLRDLEVLVVGNPPPGFGGRYFVFVKLTTDDGVVGWGECYAATVGPEAMRGVVADVFARHVAGENPENVELMFRRAYSAGFTQRPDPTVMGAFSGLEIACWDILGKARGRPVHALWGGRVWERLRSYSYLYPAPDEEPAAFYNDPDASAACAARMVAQGFTAVKFDPAGAYTIRGGHQPTVPDLERSEAFCRGIRAAVGDRADIIFGTHGQFTPSGAVRLARRIAPYDPLWFEEPVPPDLPLDLARVAAASTVPIACGERLTTKAEFATLLRAGGVGIVQPSLGRVGGLLEARKVAAMAEGFGAQVAPHLYAGPIAWAAAIQLSLSCPNFLILESIGTGAGFHADLIRGAIRWEDGYVLPPEGPGLGVEIDEAVARANPWTGDRLHLEMSEEPPAPRGSDRFAGG